MGTIRGHRQSQSVLCRAGLLHRRSHQRFFTGKAHNDYKRKRASLEWIFVDIFSGWDPATSFKEIKRRVFMPCSIIYYSRGTWLMDHEWRPWQPAKHGLHNRIFIDDKGMKVTLPINTN
jgi:hypothetical protein